MIRLFKAEFLKVWSNRFFIFSLFVLLATNFCLLWFNTRDMPNTIPASAYRQISYEIQDMTMEETGAYLNDRLIYFKSLATIESVLRQEAVDGGRVSETLREANADVFSNYYDEYSGGEYLQYTGALVLDYKLFQTILAEYEQVNEYESFLSSVQTKADSLSSISIFSQSENSYELRNIDATAEAFQGMNDVEIQYYPEKGLMTAINFNLTDVITVFSMILIAAVLVRYERDNGMLSLIRATPKGRGQTAAAKLTVAAASLFIILLLLYGINILYCGTVYGLGPLTRSIQSVPILMRSTFKLTVGQYMAAFLLTKWIAAVVCGFWVMFAMLMAKRQLSGMVVSITFLLLNLFIRAIIPGTSYMDVAKYANLVSLINTNELLGAYRNLYWFGTPVSRLLVESITAVILFILFVSLFVNSYQTHYFTGRKQKTVGLLRWRAKSTTPFRQECYKLFMMQGAGVLLLALAVFGIYNIINTTSHITADEIYYQYYMQLVEGPLTEETIGFLEEENEKFMPIYQAQQDFAENKISKNQYRFIMESNSGLIRRLEVFREIVDKVNRLGERPRMQLVYETGWLKLFDYSDTEDLKSALIAAIMCGICFSGLFAIEKQSGMIKVISVTPLGQSRSVTLKLKATVLASAIITFLTLFDRIWIIARDYGLGAWLAPVYSISEYAGAPEIPLFLMVFIQIISRFASILLMAVVTLALSEKFGNTFSAMFVSLMIFALPIVLSLAGLTNAKWVSVYLWFHICGMFLETSYLWFWLLLLVFAAVFIFICSTVLYDNLGKEKSK